MSSDHLMLWLSAGKPVAAIAVCRLWEQGALELDDRVARHIPEFGVRGKEPITIRHLLTHTGGFRLLRTGWPREPWAAIIERISAARLEPRWDPGRTAGYHLSSSWFVLGELVRRIDGRVFERWVREEIFEPLGLDDCWIGMPPERFRTYGGRLAPVWDTATAPPVPHGWDTEPYVTNCSPGANAWGPVRSLGRLYEVLLAGGGAGSVQLLSPQTVAAMTARHRVGLVDKTFRAKIDWGLGFVLESSHYDDESTPCAYGRHASPRTFGHAGYRSTTAFADPEHGLAVAIAVNGTPDEASQRRRLEAVTTAIYEDLELELGAK